MNSNVTKAKRVSISILVCLLILAIVAPLVWLQSLALNLSMGFLVLSIMFLLWEAKNLGKKIHISRHIETPGEIILKPTIGRYRKSGSILLGRKTSKRINKQKRKPNKKRLT
jgi:hypothetical protein